MRLTHRLTATAAALAVLGGLPSHAAAATPDWPVLAPLNCWVEPAQQGPDLASHLAHCRELGVRGVQARVQPAASGLAACAGSACWPLAQVLQATGQDGPGPLMLEVPVSALDAAQAAIAQAGAAARVWVLPQFERPTGEVSTALAPGVRYLRRQLSQPRPVVLHILELALDRARVEFTTTAPAGQGEDGAPRYAAERTSDFAQRTGLLAAINADYFRGFTGGQLLHQPYAPAEGAQIEVSQAHLDGNAADAQWTSTDPRVNGVLCAAAGLLQPAAGACPRGSQPLLAAGPMLLAGGQRSALQAHADWQQADASGMARYYREPHPRTAVAANPAQRRVWWLVADGRQSGYSEGLTLPEMAGLLQEMGATEAINLDGGGSSTMVLKLGVTPQVVNSPIHTSIPGRERPVANHLGLRLLP